MATNERPPLEIPVIHLNGTSEKDLLEALEQAHLKVREAIEALCQTAPNGRDYYPKNDNNASLYKAMDQHRARLQKLTDVKSELEELAEGIARQ